MSERERVKRPPLERDRPIRDRAGLFGTSSPGPQPRTESGAGPLDPTDPIAVAVDTGYRVIEEYMRQGQRVAQQFSGRSSIDPARIAVDAQDRITQMTQLFSDMAGLWLELVQDAVQQGNGRPPAIAAGRNGKGHALRADGGHSRHNDDGAPLVAAVNLVIRSNRTVSGHVDLRSEYVESTLQIHDLRGASAEQRRICDASFVPATDALPARVQVHIPDDQPPGRYSAVLVEESSGRLAGTVSIIVEEENASDTP